MDRAEARARTTRKPRDGEKTPRVKTGRGTSPTIGHIVSRAKGPANDTDLGLKRRPTDIIPDNDAAPPLEVWAEETTPLVGAEGVTAALEVDGDVTGEIEVFTAEQPESVDAAEVEEEEEEEEIEAVAAGAKGDDEPASFLAMYFRDMAELDVLRPEQEFETARNIEQMELDLGGRLLGSRRERAGFSTSSSAKLASRCPKPSCTARSPIEHGVSHRFRRAAASRKPARNSP